jgi:hypothetical protein
MTSIFGTIGISMITNTDPNLKPNDKKIEVIVYDDKRNEIMHFMAISVLTGEDIFNKSHDAYIFETNENEYIYIGSKIQKHCTSCKLDNFNSINTLWTIDHITNYKVNFTNVDNSTSTSTFTYQTNKNYIGKICA